MEEPAEPIPWLRNKDLAYYGPFRDNVKAFIKNETEADDFYVEGGILGHTVTLAKGTKYEAKMRVYEETMLDSSRVHCDCCRCIGWHHHPVTRKQYHFIIHTDFRADLKPELKGKRICQICTAAMPAKDKVCASCGENDGETSILDYQTHLMHGMLHANGCGHLMRINGREAGSRVLSGQQLIQIWEKTCNLLRAREVSVEDVSQKYGVEFRLLNPVACGKTWYGTFGYQFGKGSFGNTAATHRKAAELLRNFPLADVVHDFKNMKPRTNSSNNLLAGAAETESPQPAGDDETLEVIARYEVLMGRYAPRTLGTLVALLLRLQRIVRRNDKAEKELLLRSQRESKERGEANGDEGADAKARRREEEREAAAKRKAGTSEALFEPLAFQHHSKQRKRVGDEQGDDGVNGVESPTAKPQRRVMSSAKPRALPSRPLRPRGADGLVPATESPFKAEPAPNPRHLAASIRPQVKRELDLDPTQLGKKLASREGKKRAKPSTSAPGSTKVGSSKACPGFDVDVNTSRWSDARIETASNHCVEVLREHGGKYMPRQEVRALARAKGVGDTGLLDHVLKNISERRVILTKTAPKAEKGATQRASIKRRQNASTGQLEYMLESVPGMSKMVASVLISAGASGGKKMSSPAPPSKKSGAVKVSIKSEPAQQQRQQQQQRTTHVKPETVKRPGLTGEQNAMEEAARQLTRDDLDRDIKLVYKSVLEHYKPARPRPGRPPSKDGKGAKSKVRGADLVAAARVLLDTKQFVKTYVPVESLLTLRPPPPRGPDGQGKGGRPPMLAKGLRVLVTAVIDAKNKGPKVSGMDVSAKGVRRKHGVETKPPPEVVLLPPDPLLSDLKLAVNKCFQDLYVVLAKFKVTYAVGFESTKDATKLGAKKIGGARVEVHGDGADLESEFRYQGGLDQWVVRCVCGTCDDDGERMICCDACEVWMHTRCVSIADSQGTPRKWTCADCEDKGKVSSGGGGGGGSGVSSNGGAAPAAPAAAARERPPPTLRRPLPERILKRRKATRR